MLLHGASQQVRLDAADVAEGLRQWPVGAWRQRAQTFLNAWRSEFGIVDRVAVADGDAAVLQAGVLQRDLRAVASRFASLLKLGPSDVASLVPFAKCFLDYLEGVVALPQGASAAPPLSAGRRQ